MSPQASPALTGHAKKQARLFELGRDIEESFLKDTAWLRQHSPITVKKQSYLKRGCKKNKPTWKGGVKSGHAQLVSCPKSGHGPRFSCPEKITAGCDLIQKAAEWHRCNPLPVTIGLLRAFNQRLLKEHSIRGHSKQCVHSKQSGALFFYL